MYIKDYLDDFFNALVAERNASKETIKAYTNDFNCLFTYLDSKGTPAKFPVLSLQILRNYVSYLRIEKEYSNQTVRRKIHSLKSFYRFVHENGIIQENPMRSIRAPRREVAMPKFLSVEEINSILAAPEKYSDDPFIAKRNKAFIFCALHGGRRSEVLNLKWSTDVDFRNKTLTFRKTKSKDDRVVPISEGCVEALWEYLQLCLPVQNEYVFITKDFNKLTPSPISAEIRRYFDLLGLQDKEYSCHSFRHTYATNLAIYGKANLKDIASHLGHRDLSSSAIYCHCDIDRKREQTSALPY